MKVRVLFFGATADTVGRRSVTLFISGDTTAHDISRRLTAQHPRLANHSLLFAVNEQHADGETKLRDGDDLAIFTPVSGG
ncbi:MAG TPA: MoaD/ThiS family protein [Pyrinomonadaceae bacterium]|nr:MoaD/ThiS family protein [Pyrinomonadaceae bacterium]